MWRRHFMAVLACLTAFQGHALGGEAEADMGKVSIFLERRAQRQADEIERVVDEIMAMVAQGQLTKQEASSLLLLAHEQTLMEIGAIAGEKFAGLLSCGRGTQAREHVVEGLQRKALRHAEPWKVVANAVGVMDATCSRLGQR